MAFFVVVVVAFVLFCWSEHSEHVVTGAVAPLGSGSQVGKAELLKGEL